MAEFSKSRRGIRVKSDLRSRHSSGFCWADDFSVAERDGGPPHFHREADGDLLCRGVVTIVHLPFDYELGRFVAQAGSHFATEA